MAKQRTEANRTQPNQRRLEAAHKHLDKMFADAEGEQIDSRRFWGRIILEIPFAEGAAQEIKASKIASDRVMGIAKPDPLEPAEIPA